MKFYLFHLFPLLVYFPPSFGQHQHSLDSLTRVISASNEDTLKLNTLDALTTLLIRKSDFEPAKKYAAEAIALSEKLIAHASDSYYVKRIHRIQINAFNNLGIIARQNGNMVEAMQQHRHALQIAEEHNYKGGLAPTQNFIATLHNRLGNYPQALQHYLAALKLAEETGNKNGIASCYNNIGGIYLSQGNHADALVNFNRSLEIKKEIGDKRGIANTYHNIGEVEILRGNYETALLMLEDALAIIKELNEPDGESRTYNWIGTAHYHMGRYQEALQHHLTASQIARNIGWDYGLALAMKNAGLDCWALKQYPTGIDYLQQAAQLASSLQAKEILEDSYLYLSNIYTAQADYKNALSFHTRYAAIRDSIYNETNSRQLAEMKTRFETERKDIDIALLNKEKELQEAEIKKQRLLKNNFLRLFGLMTLLSVFIFFHVRVRNKLRLESIRNKIASDLHDDIGSTLNSISVFSEVARQKSPGSIHELEQIGQSSRKIIDALSDIVWSINTRNDNFEQIILRLRSMTYNILKAKNIEHTFRVDERLHHLKLSLEKRRSFYLIFKEAINNLVKHSNASCVTITLTYEHNRILLRIADNGRGFDTTQMANGNGLFNMKERAAEMKASLAITSAPDNGTSLELTLKPS